MKKALFPLIIALGFNAFASGAQSPLRGAASALAAKPAFRMAQINQWNNRLPYALGVASLGLASAAGVSYRYYKKYSKHEKQDSELTRLDKELKPQSEKLGKLSNVAKALDEIDTIVKRISKNNIQEAKDHMKEILKQYEKLNFKDKERIQFYMVYLGQTINGFNPQGSISVSADFLKAQIQIMREDYTKKIADLNKEMEQPLKDKKAAEDEIALLNRNKALAKWIGLSTGVTAAGLTGFGIYKWFWPGSK